MNSDLTIVGHLSELRRRIIICLVVLLLVMIVVMPFSQRCLELLKAPAKNNLQRLVFFSPQEGIMVYLKVSFFAALFISLPLILYEIWAFIAPALEDKFRRMASFFVLSTFISFVLGACFAYFVLLPVALNFLLKFASASLTPMISASSYLSFVTVIISGTGLVFEMPVVSFLLSKIGIISPAFLRRKTKYAILVIFIIAAIITPTPDIFNMLLLAIPMLLLYEISIWVACTAKPKSPVKNL